MTEILFIDAAEDLISRATNLAKTDYKAATIMLKNSEVPKIKQRQVLKEWADAQAPKKNVKVPVAKGLSKRQEAVTKLMRQRGLSHAAALDYVSSGGLEAEEAQSQMNAENPINQSLDKALETGPPQWFVDGMKAIEEKENEEGNENNINTDGSEEKKEEEKVAGAAPPTCDGHDATTCEVLD